MKQKNALTSHFATLTLALVLVLPLVSSTPAQANSARALIDLFRTPRGWALLTRTPEGTEYATRTLGREITHADDLDLLVTRLSEQERAVSLERFYKATDRIPGTVGLDNLTYLNRIAREELKLVDSLDELAFVKSRPAGSFASNSQRFLEVGEAGNGASTAEAAAQAEFVSFRRRMHMIRGTLSMDAPRAQQLEAIRKLGDLKMEMRTIEKLSPADSDSLVQPLKDLESLIVSTADDEIRKAAMEAFVRYARYHSPGYQYGYHGKWAGEAFGSLYRNTNLPDEIRRIAYNEMRVAYDGLLNIGEFKTARALLEAKRIKRGR